MNNAVRTQSADRKDGPRLFAHANASGLQFVLLSPGDGPPSDEGGILKYENEGHFVTIVGRGGTGKSVLTLQLIHQLLRSSESIYAHEKWVGKEHAAYYFTLEATPEELKGQLGQFQWGTAGEESWSRIGENHVKLALPAAEVDDTQQSRAGSALHIVSLPTSSQQISSLVQAIQQTMAEDLSAVARIPAVAIDPLGGASVDPDLRQGLQLLRELCSSHKVFLFLLVEDYLYDSHPEIEHYSQTVLHIQHDPSIAPYRRLYIQKARRQSFYSGFHQLELNRTDGVRIYPSIQAQSRNAHDRLRQIESPKKLPFFSERIASELGKAGANSLPNVDQGSVIFLMGPPGTFKQTLATAFAASATPRIDTAEQESTHQQLALYVSFKADRKHVVAVKEGLIPSRDSSSREAREPEGGEPADSESQLDPIAFQDFRNPIITPEEVLYDIGQVLEENSGISRAVIWGLRRLNDMPMFAGDNAVQFLEALVTMLTAQDITSLLIDWPDIESANTLPIVDLSQYILLTRLCRSRDSLQSRIASVLPRQLSRLLPGKSGLRRQDLDRLWPLQDPRRHVAFLWVQREGHAFNPSKGMLIHQSQKESKKTLDPVDETDFAGLWNKAGIQWENTPGLVEGEHYGPR